MRRLWARIPVPRVLRAHDSDAGVSIVEVLVAVVIFMIVSVGIAYATVSSLRLSTDAQYREVATNLAAGEIDTVRQIADPLRILDATSTVTIDDVTYTIRRDANWVSSTGQLGACGGGTGTLQYKAVRVSVSWTGQLAGTRDVQTDTIIAPDTRINDPSSGTILVSVIGADGTGRGSVTVTATPTSGGAAVTIPATDADGCSFAFKVRPGTYTVAISRSNFISDRQVTAPSASVVVTAGTSSTAAFQYDRTATFSLSYSVSGSQGTVRFPSNLDLAFFNSYGLFPRAGGAPTSVTLHPFPSGYSSVAGAYRPPVGTQGQSGFDAGCLSPDPGSWAAGTVGSTAYAAGVRRPPVAANPGSTVTMTIPMSGIVVQNANGMQLRAVSTTPGVGDPGCSTTLTYTFAALPNASAQTLALPYGTWSIQRLSGSTWISAKPQVTGWLTADGTFVAANQSGSSTAPVVVTLDPRLPE